MARRATTHLDPLEADQREGPSMRTSAIIVLAVLLVSTSAADAITITRAEVRHGLAVVEGNKATKQATVLWENGNVGQTNRGGSFSFSGVGEVRRGEGAVVDGRE